MKLFECKTPCGNCPYRKDAPREFWHRDEFRKVADSGRKFIGDNFLCHKNNGSICVGYLMVQIANGMPNIGLRLAIIQHGVSRDYFDSLYCKSELFASPEEMIEANFPELSPVSGQG
jgi:hypothetical protein